MTSCKVQKYTNAGYGKTEIHKTHEDKIREYEDADTKYENTNILKYNIRTRKRKKKKCKMRECGNAK